MWTYILDFRHLSQVALNCIVLWTTQPSRMQRELFFFWSWARWVPNIFVHESVSQVARGLRNAGPRLIHWVHRYPSKALKHGIQESNCMATTLTRACSHCDTGLAKLLQISSAQTSRSSPTTWKISLNPRSSLIFVGRTAVC